MDVSKTIVGAVVTVILLGFVVIPLTDILGNSVDNRSMNDVSNAIQLKSFDKYNATMAYDGVGAFTFSDPSAAAVTNIFVLTDTLTLWLNGSRNGAELIYKDGNGDPQFAYVQPAEGRSLTFSGTSWTYTNGDTVVTNTFTKGVATSSTGGDYYMPPVAKYPVYVDSDAEIWAWNVISNAGPFYTVIGTVEDLTIAYQKLPNNSSFTLLTGAEANYTETEYSNSMTSITLTQTEGDDLTAQQYVAIPIWYQSGPETDSLVPDLIAIMPVILIAGLIVAIAGAVVYKRRS